MFPKMSPEKVDQHLKDAFIQLCKLLELLQDKFNFHHRDLHGGNVMYKNIGTTSKPVYRWFIIDFGYSYLEKDGVKYHADAIGIYDELKKPNYAHDFRILFLYLSTYIKVPTDMKKNTAMIRFIFFVARRMNTELMRFEVKDLHWHKGYDFFDVPFSTDIFTNPRTLRRMLESGEYDMISRA